MANTSPAGAVPGCGVDSPDHCPAARRAQIQLFADSDDIDACPRLRGRIEGPVSSVCVPVSIMGRSVSVIHATAEPRVTLDDDAVRDLGTLAKLACARIGLLRVMVETQLQAATDSLTSLLNRRSFEQQVAKARRDPLLLTLAVADLADAALFQAKRDGRDLVVVQDVFGNVMPETRGDAANVSDPGSSPRPGDIRGATGDVRTTGSVAKESARDVALQQMLRTMAAAEE